MKVFITTIVLFITNYCSGQNVPNNSFENWQYRNITVNIPFVGNQNSSFWEPLSWSSSNNYAGTSTFGNKTLVSKDSISTAHLNASAKLRTDQFALAFQTFKIPGLLVLGSNLILPFTSFGNYNLNTISGAGIPYTNKPKSFHGYFKDTIVGNDSISCYAVLKNKGAVVATALFTTGVSNATFSRFEVDFKYVSCNTPDSMYMVFVSSSIGNIFAGSNDAGTSLWVDSVGLSTPIGFVPNVPLNTRNDSAFVKCTSTINIDVMANDDTCLQTGLTLSILQQSAEGNAIVNGNQIQFTKNGNAKFGFSNIRYKLCNAASECDSSFIIVNIQPRYDAVNDRDTIRCEVFKDINIRNNDAVCIGLPDTMYVVQQSNKGTSTIVNNKLRFTKNPNATPGNTVVRYVLCSSTNTECDTANVTLVVLNAKIDGRDDTISTNCLNPIQIFILTNDILACNGTFANVAFVTLPSSGSATLSPTNRVTFTPGLNSSGIIAFKYKVCEDVSGLCDTAEIRVNLGAGNKLDAKDDSLFISNTTPTKIFVGMNDTMNNCFSNKQFAITKAPVQGNATISGDTIIYTSNANSQPETFSYRMCGFFGGSNYCDTALIKIGKPALTGINNLEQSIKIFPNPFNDFIRVQSETEITRILLYNIAGTIMVDELITDNNKNIVVKDYPSGFYFVKIFTKEGINLVYKISKQ